MVITKTDYRDRTENVDDIPATFHDGELILGHNGESFEYNHMVTLEGYKNDDFIFFANHKYRRASCSMPRFLYKGKIPYELARVVDTTTNSVLYTFLRPCSPETFFCECNDCKEHFVIDCYESAWYRGRGFNMPVNRCKKCIEKRKEERNKK